MNRADKGACCLLSLLGWSLLVLIVIGGPGCRKEAPPTTGTDEPASATPATAGEVITPFASETPTEAVAAPQPDKTVVTINGKPISEGELDKRITVAMRQFGDKLANLPPQFATQVRDRLRQQVLDNLIAERLLSEQVEAAQITFTEEEVLAEMEKTGAQQEPPITVAQFRARVESQGGNFEEVKDEFRRGMSYRQFMEGQWAGKVDVNDQDARQYYDSNPAEYAIAEEVRASHILIAPDTTDPNADPNEAKVAAKEKADTLLAEIQGGADFAALAKEHSSCPSSASGGDLGFFGRNRMVKPFEEAAFAMEPGELGGPIETEFGYHIIKVTDHKDASVTSFDEAKAGIITKLTNERQSEISKQYLQSLRENATIEYPPAAVPDANAPVPVPLPEAATG